MKELRYTTHPRTAGALLWLGGSGVLVVSLIIAGALVALAVGAAIAMGSHEETVSLIDVVRLEWLIPFPAKRWYAYRYGRLVTAVPISFRLVLHCAIHAVMKATGACLVLSLGWLGGVKLVPGLPLAALGVQLGALLVLSSINSVVTGFLPTTNRYGPAVLSMAEACVHLQDWFKPARSKVCAWCGIEITRAQFGSNAALVGINGSGKTKLLFCLARSFWSVRRGKPGMRTIMLDEKRDGYPTVVGAKINARHIELLNPLDERALCAWDISEDFDTPLLAKQLAAILCPSDKGDQQPVFVRGAQRLVELLVVRLQQTARTFGLNDIVEICSDQRTLVAALRDDPRALGLARSYLGSERQGHGIALTLDTKLGPFTAVAAAMARLPGRFSLTDWYNSGRKTVLLLSNDPMHSEALQGLYAALVERLSQILLGRVEENPRDKTLLLLDEVANLGRRGSDGLAALGNLMRGGRSKGVHAVITTQSVEVLADAFGESQAKSMLGECPNLAILPPASPATRELLVRLAGNVMANATSGSDTIGSGGGSTSTSYRLEQRAAVVDAELNVMGLPTPENGIPVYARARGTGFWRGNTPPAFVRTWLPRPSKKPQHVGYIPRGPEWSAPLPLTDDDFERLGFTRPDPHMTLRELLEPPRQVAQLGPNIGGRRYEPL